MLGAEPSQGAAGWAKASGRSALKPGEWAVCRLLDGQRGRSVQLQLLAVAL